MFKFPGKILFRERMAQRVPDKTIFSHLSMIKGIIDEYSNLLII